MCSSERNMKQKVSTLAGILVPDQWTGNGEISGFALCTDDEQKYALNLSTGKDSLMVMLRQTIEVSGIVTDATGKKSISVTDFRLLPSRE